MALVSAHQHLSFRKVLLLLSLAFFLFASVFASAFSETLSQRKQFLGSRRRLLDTEKEDQPKKKITSNLSTKNQTKIIKPTTNSTKTLTNNTQLKKLNSNSKSSNPTKSNSTSVPKSVKSNSTSDTKSSDLLKTSIPKNKITQAIITKHSQEPTENKSIELKSKSSEKTQFTEKKPIELKSKSSEKTQFTEKKPIELKSKSSEKTQFTEKKPIELKSKSSEKTQFTEKKKPDDLKPKNSDKNQFTEKKPGNLKPKNPDKTQFITDKKSIELKTKTPDKNQKPKTQKPKTPDWIEQEKENDLVSEFRDLPSKFHETFLPDLERISTTSKAYLTQANEEIARGFKPLVGNKYAPTIASVISCAFILLPLLLVSLIFNRIKAYFSLQKILIFIQIYLSIYFSILCFSSLVTGLEPLKFFYDTSQPTYVCLQVLQTLGYVFYLLLLLMHLVLVFSTESGLGSKLLGLGQIFVGFSVGLHYYIKVFHRTVLHQPPKTNWKVHGIYATCFLVICLFAGAERRKKAYLEEGGEEGKKK